MAWSADQAGTSSLELMFGQSRGSLGGQGIQALAGNGTGGQILAGAYDTIPAMGVAAYVFAARASGAPLQAARLRLAGQINALLRQKAGFSANGTPLIIDSNSMRAGMADALRARGYNVCTVSEIFGTDPGDPAIAALAENLGGKVLTNNMQDFGRNIAIKIDPRAISLDTWIRLIENRLK